MPAARQMSNYLRVCVHVRVTGARRFHRDTTHLQVTTGTRLRFDSTGIRPRYVRPITTDVTTTTGLPSSCGWQHCGLNKLCGRPPQYAPAPSKLTFDLESGVLVTCDVGYLCANFGLPRPLCSRLRPDVRDRQTSDKSIA